MRIEIDRKSGFCFGVIKAIRSAEEELEKTGHLYCLGDIVHNGREVKRLKQMGLRSITRDEYFSLSDCKVLIRAHGEPPEVYSYASKNNIELIDATCPVVLTLQEKVKHSYESKKNEGGQVVIFGKRGHAEIIGLDGQTNNTAIVVESINDVDKIDMTKPVSLYSQTTKRIEDFHQIAGYVHSNRNNGVAVEIKDTICRQVSNRVPHLQEFSSKFDMVLFVAGKKSSNGQYLFSICKEVNKNAHVISDASEIDESWFQNVESVGICGATSTPNWLMEEVAQEVRNKYS